MSDLSYLGSSPSLASAIKYAERMVSKLGHPAAIYHQPIDGCWFIIPASSVEVNGAKIKALVYPAKQRQAA
jgi:hypothetical protein